MQELLLNKQLSNLKFGVGYGKLHTHIGDDTNECDGPVFWNARTAIYEFENGAEGFLRVKTGDRLLDSSLECLIKSILKDNLIKIINNNLKKLIK